jgi:biopolymer transport protein ExbB/TolQ
VRKLQRQKHAMLLDVLPTDIAEDITAENVGAFIEHVQSLPSRLHASFMVKRMRRGLEHFQVRRSNPEVASMMLSQSEIDAGAIHSSYTLLKVFIWAIPILGFIGTVLGISDAVGAFSGSLDAATDIEVLKTSLNSVTAGLAVAFDTTLIALVISLIISFPASAMQKAEEDLLGWVDAYCNENLLKRLNDAGGVSEVASHTEAIMEALGAAVTENQRTILDDFHAVQQDMAEVLQGLATAVDEQLQAMEQRAAEHQKQIEEGLAKTVGPIDQAMATLSERGEASVRDTTEAMQTAAQGVQAYCDALTEGLGSLNKILGELGGKRVVVRKPRRARRFRLFGGGRRKKQAAGTDDKQEERRGEAGPTQ